MQILVTVQYTLQNESNLVHLPLPKQSPRTMSSSKTQEDGLTHVRGSHRDQAAFASGDLGKGRGLKPGALSVDTEEERKSSFTEFFNSKSRKCTVSTCRQCTRVEGTNSKTCSPSDNPDDSVFSFPKYAGVPFGTSLRQHRKLYEATRKGLPGQLPDASLRVGPDGKNVHAFFLIKLVLPSQ